MNVTVVLVRGYGVGVRVRVKIAKYNVFFVAVPVPPANYSEPQFHESFMNSGKEKQLFPLPRHQ